MGGNPAAGLLLLLVGVFLLVSYVTGRLDWLFSLGHDLNAARTASAPAPAPAAATPAVAGIPYPGTAPALPPMGYVS